MLMPPPNLLMNERGEVEIGMFITRREGKGE